MKSKIISALGGLLLLSAITIPQSLGFPNLINLQPKKVTELLPEQLFTITEPEMQCLAMNIYHEARNDMLAGQFAVADVVLNRVNDARYPNTICDVIKEGPVKESWKTKQTPDPNDAVYHPVRNRCQFSWYCDGKPDDIDDIDSWKQAQSVAYMIINRNIMRGITEGSTHYHATYVSPKWAPTLYSIGRIGKHQFYKWL